MKYINMQRGAGKSTVLIHTAYATGYPILVIDSQRGRNLRALSSDLGFDDIRICTLDEWVHHRLSGMYEHILIDELEDLIPLALQNLLNTPTANMVMSGTMSIPMLEVHKKDESVDSQD